MPTLLAMLLLAYANGANDIAKAIAPLVGGKAASYRQAVVWRTVWTMAGACLGDTLALSVVHTFTTGILSEAVTLPPLFPLTATVGALSWVLFASWAGFPVSTTHALVGALCGAALLAQGATGILWFELVSKIVIPLLLSPLLALLVTFGLSPAIRHTVGRWKGACLCVSVVQEALIPLGNVTRAARTPLSAPTLLTVYDVPENCGGGKGMALSLTPEMLLWLSGGFVSFARGLNDTPKIVAVVAAAALIGKDDPSIMRMAFPLAAVAMGIGSLWGGRRVTKRLAEDVTALDSLAGLTASLATAVLVTLATQGGLPVSTTHVSSGAIVGVGLRNGTERVQWQTVRHFLMAWVVTLPAAGVIAACSLLGLPLVMPGR